MKNGTNHLLERCERIGVKIKYSNMGQPKAQKAGRRSKIKKYKRAVWLCNRDKDIDQIQDEIALQTKSGIPVVQRLMTNNDPIQLLEQINNAPAELAATTTTTTATSTIPYDDELPGGGQYYCVETAKHFIDARALQDHKKTKFYKRRVKELQQQTHHTQITAEWAAGRTKEVLPPISKRTTEKTDSTNTIAPMSIS
jgi:bud site selection protein 20